MINDKIKKQGGLQVCIFKKKIGIVLWTYGKPKDKSKIIYQLASGNSCVHCRILIRNRVLENCCYTTVSSV